MATQVHTARYGRLQNTTTNANIVQEVVGARAGLILVILLAILFLLLSLCCLLYFLLKCRCVGGQSLWYREPLFTYRRQAAWPWATLDASTSSESGEGEHFCARERSKTIYAGMSSAFGKTSDYYPPLEIPRAKLARPGDYADGRYDVSLSLIQCISIHSIFQNYSETSTEYSVREEIERRVTTDTRRIVHGTEEIEVGEIDVTSIEHQVCRCMRVPTVQLPPSHQQISASTRRMQRE